MTSAIPAYLSQVLERYRTEDGGANADYIPALAQVDSQQLALALVTTEGDIYTAGDDQALFTIQSMSKPFAYGAVLEQLGPEQVANYVGLEPSGEAFNHLSLDEATHLPKNPMINAGALAIHQLIVSPKASSAERVEAVRSFFSALAGRQLSVDYHVYASELETAHRNMAIAHMLKNFGVIEADPYNVVTGYTAQCSLLVTVKDIATMAATLASGGVQPVTGQRLLSPANARMILSVMAASGMYDAAGSWFTDVGIPAKSGVSGGILGAVPGQAGLAVFSPRLDKHGHSVRGVKIASRLAADLNFHVLAPRPVGCGPADIEDQARQLLEQEA